MRLCVQQVVLVDSLSPERCHAISIAKGLVYCVMLPMALFPSVWRSDNARELWSEIMTEMTRLLGARHIGSSPYHPQSQDAVESLHKTVNNVVTSLVQEHPEEWE